MSERRFDESYRESVKLRDGTEVTIRLVRADDRALLEEGFERLSDRSRYYRFFTAKPRLTDAEARYLTDVDGEDHFAIGASTVAADGTEQGLGVARFIRLDGEPEVAEAAVTVLDEVQGQGLGSLLLLRLIAAARERGVHVFRCWALVENHDALALFHELFPRTTEHVDGHEVVIDAPLPEVAWDLVPAARPIEDTLYRLLRHTASGALKLLGFARAPRDDRER